jgi:hypothetical protein
LYALLALMVLLGPSLSRAFGENQSDRTADRHQSLAPIGELDAPAKPTFPAPELIDDCQREARKLRRQLDSSFRIRVEPPFIVAGDLSAEELDGYVRNNLLRPAKAMWSTYFDTRPDRVITILLMSDRDSYEKWAMKLFRDDDLPYFGYYKPYYRTLIMNISTGGGTLVHELTHALVAYDFPGIPLWFNEAMASLHEESTISGDGRSIVGKANWRLRSLQRAIRGGRLRPLRDLITKKDFYDDAHRGLNYGQARHFALYMQEKGLLKSFYESFRKEGCGRDLGLGLVERTFGKRIGEIERDYNKWVLTLDIE